jgi:hypothetical protein
MPLASSAPPRAGCSIVQRSEKFVRVLDVLVVCSALALALLVPIFFMVPYNDEWIRVSYLADHSVWEWTIYHTQTWVVRPTAELIMGFVSVVNTRRMLEPNFNAAAFLARFHQMYVALVATLFALLYLLAAVLARRWRALHEWTLLCACMAICILMSDELGYALYWADGWANVVLPFFLMSIGMVLLARRDAYALLGAVLLLMAALAHEVLCIFGSGYCLLTLALRRFDEHPVRARLLLGGLALLCLGVLYAQAFSTGPTVRSEVYFRRTGQRYNLAGVWHGIQTIDPVRSLLAFIAVLLLLAIACERVSGPVRRALDDARAHRAYWCLLVAGALLTSLLPLGTVGLKKPTVAIAAYSVATELFVILSAVLFYPLVGVSLNRLLASYRKRVGSVLLVLFALLPFSKNLGSYAAALRDFDALRGEARVYTETLFTAQRRARVVRPCHPFVKPNSGLSGRHAAQYFGLERVRELACPK